MSANYSTGSLVLDHYTNYLSFSEGYFHKVVTSYKKSLLTYFSLLLNSSSLLGYNLFIIDPSEFISIEEIEDTMGKPIDSFRNFFFIDTGGPSHLKDLLLNFEGLSNDSLNLVVVVNSYSFVDKEFLVNDQPQSSLVLDHNRYNQISEVLKNSSVDMSVLYLDFIKSYYRRSLSNPSRFLWEIELGKLDSYKIPCTIKGVDNEDITTSLNLSPEKFGYDAVKDLSLLGILEEVEDGFRLKTGDNQFKHFDSFESLVESF